MSTAKEETTRIALPSPPSDSKQQIDYICSISSSTSSSSNSSGSETIATPAKKEQNNHSNNKASLIQPLKSASTSIKSTTSIAFTSSSPSDIIMNINNHKRGRSNSLPPRKYDIIHDPNCCMFKIQLDSQGTSAALCYLPTRYKNIIEFYHVEIPVAYRNQGFGDILLYKAFQWVEKSNFMVIPTCPFVLKYLESRFPEQKNLPCILLKK